MNVATIDIETPLIPKEYGIDGIDKIFCIAVKSNKAPTRIFTYLYHPMSSGNLKSALDYINKHDYVIGHNICQFDIPVIELLVGKITAKPIDTYLDSVVMYSTDELYSIDRGIKEMPPRLWGSYSLKAFGYRLDDYKIEFEQFDKLTSEMLTYCIKDTELSFKLFEFNQSQPNYPAASIRELEYNTARIITEQERFGFYFDIEAAKKLAVTMKFQKMNLEHQLLKVFKPKFLPEGPTKVPSKDRRNKAYVKDTEFVSPFNKLRYIRQYKITKNGKYQFPPKNKIKWFDTPHRLVYTYTLGEYQPIKLTKFDPGSRHKIRHWLKEDLGFEFTTYTEKGTPKVEAEALENMEHPSGKLMREYLKLVKDLSQLETGDGSLITNYREHNHTLTSNINTNGTVTGRFTSSNINLNQIPSQQEFRELFTAPTYYVFEDTLYFKIKEYL